MKYQELIILLPCHSLEDFPLHHEAEEAEGLLACWTALWHPALMAAAGSTPVWYRVDEPPVVLADRLIVIPAVSQHELPADLVARAENDGARVITQQHRQAEILAAALESLDGGAAQVDEDLAEDFLALGYAYLQIELLTRQMRYSSNLDEPRFKEQAVAAAVAATQGQFQQARDHLASCFDVLAEERDHYYPVDVFLVDLTLVAATTIGPALGREIAGPSPVNLLIAAETLGAMSRTAPQTLVELRDALEHGKIGLLGGESRESPLPMLSPETILHQLQRGLAEYEEHLGRRPHVFGRRRFGLTPMLPQILERVGFQAALHATLDDGRFPQGAQACTFWEGVDGSTINSLARVPLDATRPETFLNYAVKLGESMDTDHIATRCFAHWPGQVSPWYQYLRRIASYTKVLGNFVTVDEYFRETEHCGQLDRFEPDQYRSPYLQQSLAGQQSNPISRWVRYWRHRGQLEALQGLETMVQFLRGNSTDAASSAEATRLKEAAACPHGADEQAAAEIDDGLAAQIEAMTQQLAAVLPRAESPEQGGYLIANPRSFVRRVGLELSELSALPAEAKPVYAASQSHGRKHVVVDVPPLGLAWIAAGTSSQATPRSVPHIATDEVLRNEYFEARIDLPTGSLRSIHDYKTRGNRLSQQIALRLPGARKSPDGGRRDRDETALYSVMAADSVEVTASDATLGEITATGRLVDRQGNTLAGFRQTYRLWRGCRVLLVDIEIDPHEQPDEDAWNSYYACRFAWPDESSILSRSVNGTRQQTSAKRMEAPLLVEIDQGEARTAILTGGLPYHRRVGMRMLDSLLIVRGETCRRFRMGIAIGARHPLQDAWSLLTPMPALHQSAAPPTVSPSSWLCHLDAKNVMATFIAPIYEAEQLVGLRARLLETEGRRAKVRLSVFQPLESGRKVDFHGNPLSECEVIDGGLQLEMTPFEWAEVETRWRL